NVPAEVPPTEPAGATSASALLAHVDDRELIEKTRAGDRAAFGGLVRRHQHRILWLALHLLHDRAAAEGGAQPTFVRAYPAGDGVDGWGDPYTWLCRIAVNLSLHLLRGTKEAGIALSSDDPRLEGSEDGAGGSTPGERMLRRVKYVSLCEGIDSLQEGLKTTLI